MDRWCGFLKVSLNPQQKSPLFNIFASLCFSPSSKTPIVPSANAVFFTGDRVKGTGNPVIERLCDARTIADILVSKLGKSVNAWIVEASFFNGPFAVYKEFIPSVNSWGETAHYDPTGFPASNSTVMLISKCLNEVKKMTNGKQDHSQIDRNLSRSPTPSSTKTIVIGFSKGGTVLNQLVTELAHVEAETRQVYEENSVFPTSKESLLSSISDIHYVDVGLNSSGAYITDEFVIKKISDYVSQRISGIRFTLHGTPRQWCDSNRVWIKNEKNRLLRLLEDAESESGGKLRVCERFYFADRRPDLQMHFEIIESLDLS